MIGIFLDIETTGLDPVRHCVLEIAFRLVNLVTGEWGTPFSAVVRPSREAWERADPFSLTINGMTWEEVEKGRPQEDVVHDILDIFSTHSLQRGHAVFICQNPAFDRMFFAQLIALEEQEKLRWPYHWLDLASMYWGLIAKESVAVGHPLPDHLPLSKNDIARHYGLPAEALPHRAMNGVDHLITCYQAVIGIPHLSKA